MNEGHRDQVMGQNIRSNSKYRRFFIFTQNSEWFRGQPSLIFSGYQEFFVWWKSGCIIRNLTTHLHLKLQLTISAVKPFLPILVIVKSTRKLHIDLYWLCACKSIQHSRIGKGKSKDQWSIHDTSHCNFVRQIEGGRSEASRCQSNNGIFCIHRYFVLQSLVTRNSHFLSQMYQMEQMWNRRLLGRGW